MNCLKLVADGKVVDALKDPCFVVYVPRLALFLACPEAQAQGVAHRNGATYWQLEGREAFGVDGYTTVSAIPIFEEEADALIAALDAGEKPVEPDPNQDPGNPGVGDVITLASLSQDLKTTQAEVDALNVAIQKGLSL